MPVEDVVGAGAGDKLEERKENGAATDGLDGTPFPSSLLSALLFLLLSRLLLLSDMTSEIKLSFQSKPHYLRWNDRSCSGCFVCLPSMNIDEEHHGKIKSNIFATE